MLSRSLRDRVLHGLAGLEGGSLLRGHLDGLLGLQVDGGAGAAGAGLEGAEAGQNHFAFLHDAFGLDKMTLTDSGNLIHHLTHRTIHARFLRAELQSPLIQLPENTRLVDPVERKKLPVSRLIDKYLHQL